SESMSENLAKSASRQLRQGEATGLPRGRFRSGSTFRVTARHLRPRSLQKAHQLWLPEFGVFDEFSRGSRFKGRSSSMFRSSSSNVDLSSLEALRNSANPLPKDFPNSGSFRGPKTIKATTKMMINSGTPIDPMLSSKTNPSQASLPLVFYKSFSSFLMAFLKFLIPSPMPLPTSGSLLAPKR